VVKRRLQLDILPQPDPTTCGPTCLHAVYRYFGETILLDRVIAETQTVPTGGTLAVLLANHALRRGYEATLYTYNLQVFDPTWFVPGRVPLTERVAQRAEAARSQRLRTACKAYQEYLALGGRVHFEDLTPDLIRRHLKAEMPILTGLSATYLYRTAREFGPNDEPDDVRGDPTGHFVVLCGYDRKLRNVLVADPMHPNPVAPTHLYEVRIERLICSILMGILTYDGNLLVLEPRSSPRSKKRGKKRNADPGGRRNAG
jgi:hypothetical protein